MEGLITIQASDLSRLFEQINMLRAEIKELKEHEENIHAYSVQQTAELLNVCYNTVRKLIQKKILFAKYPGDTTTKAIIPCGLLKPISNYKKIQINKIFQSWNTEF